MSSRRQCSVYSYPITVNISRGQVRYRCKYCLFESDTILETRFHVEKRHPEKQPDVSIECHAMEKSSHPYPSKRSRLEVKVKISSDIGPRQVCLICKISLDSVFSLKNHVLASHKDFLKELENLVEKTKSNICPICKTEFINQSKLKLHLRKYSLDDVIENCVKRNSGSDNDKTTKPVVVEELDDIPLRGKPIQPNILIKHNQITCQFCYNSFRTKISLNKHLEEYHKVTKNKFLGFYPADVQIKAKTFNLQHQKPPLSISKTCPYCDTEHQFASSADFDRHMALHRENLPPKITPSQSQNYLFAHNYP